MERVMQHSNMGAPGRAFAGRVALAAASWLAVTAGGAQAATFLSNVPDTALNVLEAGLPLASGVPGADGATGLGGTLDTLLIDALTGGGEIYASSGDLLAYDATRAFVERGGLFSAVAIPKPSRWTSPGGLGPS